MHNVPITLDFPLKVLKVDEVLKRFKKTGIDILHKRERELKGLPWQHQDELYFLGYNTGVKLVISLNYLQGYY